MFPWHQNFNYNCQGLNPYDCSCLRRTRRPTRTSRSRWKMMWRHQRRQLDLNLKFVGSPWGTVIKVYILLWFLSSCMSYSILEKCWQTWGWSQMMMIIKLPSTIIYVFVVGHDTWDPKPPKNTGTSSCPKVHICAFAQYAQEASSGAAAALEDSKYKGDLNVRLGTSCSQGCANNQPHEKYHCPSCCVWILPSTNSSMMMWPPRKAFETELSERFTSWKSWICIVPLPISVS